MTLMSFFESQEITVGELIVTLYRPIVETVILWVVSPLGDHKYFMPEMEASKVVLSPWHKNISSIVVAIGYTVAVTPVLGPVQPFKIGSA